MYVVTSCWFSHPFPEPDSVLIAEANKVVNFKIWTCHAVHFYIGLTMSVERKTGERMIRHFVYLRGGHFIYLRGGSKFANISASAGHAPRRGHLLLFECSLLPLEGSLSCCMKCRLQIFTAVFCHCCGLCFYCSRAPSYLSRVLSLILPEFLPSFDLAHRWLSSALFRCLRCQLQSCQDAKLPSCIRFFSHTQNSTPAIQGFLLVTKIPSARLQF